MLFWILVIVYFLLASISFASYFYFAMPKKKKIRRKRCRSKRKLPKEVAERIVENNLSIYKKKAKGSMCLGIFFVILLFIVLTVKILFPNKSYNKYEVRVDKNEKLGTSVDPISFMDEVDDSGNASHKDEGEAGNNEEIKDEDGDSGVIIQAENKIIGNESTQGENNDNIMDGVERNDDSDENVHKVDDQTGSDTDEIEKEVNNSKNTQEGKNASSNIVEETEDISSDEKPKKIDNTENKADIKKEDNFMRAEGIGEERSSMEEGVDISASGNTQSESGNNIDSSMDIGEGIINGGIGEEGDDSILYDYSPLLLWGSYEFGALVRGQDLANIENRIEEYFDNEEYVSMFGEILETLNDDYKVYSEEAVLNRINSFKQEKDLNPDLLSATKYFTNAMDNLFLYKENKNTDVLEQAAISAEGAVEKEQLIISEGYNNYITYDKTGIIIFCYVSGLDLEKYDSGTKEDIKYRIGKLLYKPVANLLHISSVEKYYSLCSSYVILRDVFEERNPECKYVVEISFYYLSVCVDLIEVMEPGEARKEVCKNAINAYDKFKEDGEKYPDNLTYMKYATDAYEKLQMVEQEYALEIEREQDGETELESK